MSAPYSIRSRARRGDRARILLAIVLIIFTALVGILGAAPVAKAQEVSAADQTSGLQLGLFGLTRRT